MRKNLVKEKLSKGGNGIGIIVPDPAPSIVEILGLLGFDWALLDCQHSPMSIETIAHLIKAAELAGITPIVRVPLNVPEITLRYMDVGAQGIMVPDMDNKEIAEKAVRAVKYPPRGARGLSAVRAADYGLKGPLAEYMKVANAETVVWGVIESKEGVENIEEILGTEGIDSVTVGPNDLSKSLGVPGETNHPKVLAAIDKVLAAGRKLGKPIGGGPRPGETIKQYTDKGFRIVSTSLYNVLIAGGRQFLESGR